MFEFADPETFWLNVTNAALGVVTLVCVVVVVAVALQELGVKFRKHVSIPAVRDDHAFLVPELGMTMADGGERYDEKTHIRKTPDAKTPADEPHIVRSDN